MHRSVFYAFVGLTVLCGCQGVRANAPLSLSRSGNQVSEAVIDKPMSTLTTAEDPIEIAISLDTQPDGSIELVHRLTPQLRGARILRYNSALQIFLTPSTGKKLIASARQSQWLEKQTSGVAAGNLAVEIIYPDGVQPREREAAAFMGITVSYIPADGQTAKEITKVQTKSFRLP